MKKQTTNKVNEELKTKIQALLKSEEVSALTEQIKAATETGTFEIIVSSEHEDRAGDIVLQDGIDVTSYMKNPVVLNSHDYYGIDNIIGLTESLTREVIDGVKCTIARGKWAPTDNGQIARKLWEGGFLNAGSIGFIALGFDASNPAIITRSEMLEWSACSVPCNREAIRRGMANIGLTAEGLIAKGFTVDGEDEGTGEEKQEEVKAEGEPCTMEDGSPGAYDASGVCVVKAAPAPEKTAEEIAAEETAKAISDYYEKAEHKEKDARQIGAVLMQLQNIIDNALVTASKIIMDIIQSEYGKSEAGKAEIAELIAGDASLQAIKLVTADVERKLGIFEGEEQPVKVAPEQRSEDAGSLASNEIKNLDSYLEMQRIVRSITTVAQSSLQKINKKLADEKKRQRR